MFRLDGIAKGFDAAGALCSQVNRKLLVKDTGRKLSHLDNQLQAEGTDGLPPFLKEGR